MAVMICLTLVVWILAQLCAGSPQNAPLMSITAAPDSLSSGVPQGAGQCGGCYVVADIAGVVFAPEPLNQTVATAYLITIMGKNGTNITSVSIAENPTPFTVNPSGLITGSRGGTTQLITDSIITLSGVTLTSPTAYDVFTAYSVTSAFLSNGVCTTSSGNPIPVIPAFSYPVPEGTAGADFQLSAENAFISQLGLIPTCSGGGGNVGETTHQSTMNITQTVSGGSISFFPLPIVTPTSAAPQTSSTVAPTTTKLTTITPSSTLTLTTTVTIGTIVIALNATTSTIPELSTSLVSAVIIGNSTVPLPTGTGVFTIIPYTGQGPGSSAVMHTDISNSWLLLWTAGAIGIAGFMWIL